MSFLSGFRNLTLALLVSGGALWAEDKVPAVSSVKVFSGPLVAVRQQADPGEEGLVRLLQTYGRGRDRSAYHPLLQYLEAHGDSRWAPALRVHIAERLLADGAVTRARLLWRQAWTDLKGADQPQLAALADQAVARLAQSLMWSGDVEALAVVVGDIGTRTIAPPWSDLLSRARGGLQQMKDDPARAFNCGPLALEQLLAANGVALPAGDWKQAVVAERRGTNFQQLKNLGIPAQRALRVVKCDPRNMPVPCIAHWKVGHFAVLLAGRDGRVLMRDANYDPLSAGEMAMKPAVLADELSGYALVFADAPASGTVVEEAEAAGIWGRCAPAGLPTRDLTSCDTTSGGPGGCGGGKGGGGGGGTGARVGMRVSRGMPVYTIHTAMVSLKLDDTPVGYQPSKGPGIYFSLSYLQRNPADPVRSGGGLGARWTHAWTSYVRDLGNNHFDVQPLGGGLQEYVISQDLGNGLWASPWHPRSSMQLVKQVNQDGSIAWMELRAPEGSRMRYGVSDGAMLDATWYLTQAIGTDGDQVQFGYVPNANDELRLTTVTDAVGQVTNLDYNASGQLVTVRDPWNRQATLEYNGDGMLAAVTDVINLRSTFQYDAVVKDRMASMTTPYGTWTFDIGESGSLRRWVEVIMPALDGVGFDRERVEYSQDYTEIAQYAWTQPDQMPADMVFPPGYEHEDNTLFWDKKAMKILEKDPAINRYSLATYYRWMRYQGSTLTGLIARIKQPLVNPVWYNYPGQESGFPTLWSPSKVGQVVGMVDGAAVTALTRTTYNAQGQPLTVIDPEGRLVEYTYDGTGARATAVSVGRDGVAGRTVVGQAEYDSAGRPTAMIDAAGARTTYQYDAQGRLWRVTPPLRPNKAAEWVQYTYASSGFLDRIDQANGQWVDVDLDVMGRLVKTTTQEGYVVEQEYDAFDRPTRTRYPDGTTEEVLWNRLDAEWVKDRAGRWTHTVVNAHRQPVMVWDTEQRLTTFGWCRCGALKEIVDPRGKKTAWAFDVLGRQMSKTYADGKMDTFQYDPRSGRLVSSTDAKGQKTVLTYFKDGRVQSINYENAVVATSGLSFIYDPVFGRLQSRTDAAGETQFLYYPITPDDPQTPESEYTPNAGRLLAELGPVGATNTAWSYDVWGRVLTRTIDATVNGLAITGGVTTTASYDDLGRISGDVHSVLGSRTLQYVGDTGRVNTLSGPAGLVSAFSYSGLNDGFRLQGIQHRVGAQAIAAYGYGYHADGTIGQWSQAADGGAAAQWTFGYDRTGQLLEAHRGQAGVFAAMSQRFRYDGAGNRITYQAGTAVQTWDFNAVNQLMTAAAGGRMRVEGTINEPGSVQVDGVPARMTSSGAFVAEVAVTPGTNRFTVVATDTSNNVRTQAFDVAVAGGAGWSAQYDAVGNCTDDGQRQYTWDAANRIRTITRGAHVTEFTYDGLGRRTRMVERENGVLQEERRLVWSGAQIVEEQVLDGNGVQQHVRKYCGYGEVLDGTVYYYLRDHLGSVRELVDASGVVRARYDYDPWGNRTKLSGTVDTPVGFTGHYHHAASGLVLTWFRAYDPAIGRWLSRDPIGEKGGINLYGYVNNSPLIGVDPLGLYDIVFYYDGNESDQNRWKQNATDIVAARCSGSGVVGKFTGINDLAAAIERIAREKNELPNAIIIISHGYPGGTSWRDGALTAENAGDFGKKIRDFLHSKGSVHLHMCNSRSSAEALAKLLKSGQKAQGFDGGTFFSHTTWTGWGGYPFEGWEGGLFIYGPNGQIGQFPAGNHKYDGMIRY